MNKSRKIKIAFSSLITLLPTILSILGVCFFDEKITAAVKTTSWRSAAHMFIILPLILVAIYLIAIMITLKENKNRQSEKVINLVFFIIPAISLFSFFITTGAIFGFENSLTMVTGVFVGVVFVLLGNYLPKCTRNKTIGIRIKWTLLNEENWASTHRFSGKLWFACGILIIIASFLPEKLFFPILLVGTVLTFLISTLYSYLYYKKQKEKGEWKIDTPRSTYSKKTTAAVTALVVIILCFSAFVIFTGEINISANSEKISIEASYWSDTEISVSDIEKITLTNQVDGRRISGVGTPTLHIGIFKNNEFGTYIRYTYTKTQKYIVVTTHEEIFVINLETEEATEKLYREIASLTSSN